MPADPDLIAPVWAPSSLEFPMPFRQPPLGWHWEAWDGPFGAVPECWLLPRWAAAEDVGLEDPYALLLVWAEPQIGYIWYSVLLSEGILGMGPPASPPRRNV